MDNYNVVKKNDCRCKAAKYQRRPPGRETGPYPDSSRHLQDTLPGERGEKKLHTIDKSGLVRNGEIRMDGEAIDAYSEKYTWILSFGLMSISTSIILWGPEGMVFDGLRGLTTGIALCSGLAYLVLANLPEKYR